MTITIKKVRNYALLGTIISANATAPAQASLFKNTLPDNDLIETLQNQALSEIQMSNQPDYCISFPELDLCNQSNNNNQNSLNNLLFQKAQSSIKSIEAAERIEIKTLTNGTKHIIYNTEFTPLASEEDPISQTYTTVWQSEKSDRKKVPEPSALLGLIAFCLFAAKHQPAKSKGL